MRPSCQAALRVLRVRPSIRAAEYVRESSLKIGQYIW